SRTRLQVSLKARSATSKAPAGPVWSVFIVSYLARHSFTAGFVLAGLAEVGGFGLAGASRARQVSLKARRAASNTSAGPVLSVFSVSYLARHSFTAGFVLAGLAEVVGFGLAGASRVRQVSLKVRRAASNTSAGPVFIVLR